MGLLKHLRSRTKLKENGHATQHHAQNGNVYYPGSYAVSGRDYTARLPPKVLAKIFELVCPHTLDKSYEPCEDADIADDSCPLCDLRDLSHCAQTRRSWYRPATQLLCVDPARIRRRRH
jgi:hypothetical protein